MTAPTPPVHGSLQLQSSAGLVRHGWRSSSSLSEWLFAEGYRFEFIQALRLLEQLGASISHNPVGELAPGHEPFQLRSAVGFNFPPSEVRSVSPGDTPDAKPELITNFFSLAGSAAPLPDWIAELLIQQARNRDSGIRDFLDIFHHRLLTLLYRVRLRHRPWLEPTLTGSNNTSSQTRTSNQIRAQNRMSGYLLAFIGLGLPELRNRLPIGDEELLPYAGLLWQRPRSMAGLERILAHSFSVQIRSRQMIGLWRRIERDDWTRLGTQRLGRQIFTQSRGQNNALGHTTVLGTRTWDSQGRFDIIVGPLNLAQFQSFLPGGASHKKLTAIIHFYAGDLLDCGIRLSIAPAEVPATRLSKSRLGWTSWLKTKPSTNTRHITLFPIEQ
jgi:type VI secretion system protein ImpH